MFKSIYKSCSGKRVVLLILCFCILRPEISFGLVPFSGVVKKIIDGDSIIVYAKKKSIEVRLYGIDCPEYNQPFAKQAKQYVKSKIKRKTVIIQPQYYDSYGRLVAVISHGNTILNGEIVEAGLAWVYTKYCKKGFCRSWKKRERNAKRLAIGLWRGKKPIPPWKWRRNKQ